MANWWDAKGFGHFPSITDGGGLDSPQAMQGARDMMAGFGGVDSPYAMQQARGMMAGFGGQPAPTGGFTPFSALGLGGGSLGGGAIGALGGAFGGGSGGGVAPFAQAMMSGRAAQPMNVYGATGYAGPGQPMGGAPAGGGMVLLRAPTGQTQAVPAAQAEYFVARGATRV